MKPMSRVAFIAAIIGPIQSVSGWLIAGTLWPEYDPIRQTISDLAATESPVNGVMSSFFILGGTLTIIAGIFGRTFAMPGRIVLVVAGLCTYGLTIFPTPLVGYSIPHRIFAISSFALSAGWPLFTMRIRRDAPWLLRPVAALTTTGIQAASAIWFLATWTLPDATNVGVWERVVATQQSLFLSLTVIVIYLGQRSHARASQGTAGT
jgi:hypothetical membrane protein